MEDWGSFFDQAPTTQAQLPVAAMRAAVRSPGAFSGKGIFPTASANVRPATALQSPIQPPRMPDAAPLTPPGKIAQSDEWGDDAKGLAGLANAVTGEDKPKKDSFSGAMATIDQQLAAMRAEREQALGTLNSGQSGGAQTNPNASVFSGTLPPGSAEGNFGRMIKQESGGQHFRNGAPITSSAGAIGIAQIMPGTAPYAAKLAGLAWDPVLFSQGQTGDPEKDAKARDYNLALGKAYYEQQLKDFGDPNLAAAAYNAGPGNVQKALAKAKETGHHYINFLPAETQNYVKIVSGPTEEKKTAEAETGYARGGRLRYLSSMFGGNE